MADEGSNPCAVLNKRNPYAKYNIIQTSVNPDKFMATIKIDSTTFIGEGLSKKLAKNDAAKQALQLQPCLPMDIKPTSSLGKSKATQKPAYSVETKSNTASVTSFPCHDYQLRESCSLKIGTDRNIPEIIQHPKKIYNATGSQAAERIEKVTSTVCNINATSVLVTRNSGGNTSQNAAVKKKTNTSYCVTNNNVTMTKNDVTKSCTSGMTSKTNIMLAKNHMVEKNVSNYSEMNFLKTVTTKTSAPTQTTMKGYNVNGSNVVGMVNRTAATEHTPVRNIKLNCATDNSKTPQDSLSIGNQNNKLVKKIMKLLYSRSVYVTISSRKSDFIMSAKVFNKMFTGKGSSKTQAKLEVAKNVLEYIMSTFEDVRMPINENMIFGKLLNSWKTDLTNDSKSAKENVTTFPSPVACDRTFIGEAGSKKLARLDVTRKVLDYVEKHPNNTMVKGKVFLKTGDDKHEPKATLHPHVSSQEKEPKETNKNVKRKLSFNEKNDDYELQATLQPHISAQEKESEETNKTIESEDKKLLRNIMILLYHRFVDATIPDQESVFTMSAKVYNKLFTGKGCTKTQARLDVARKVLQHITLTSKGMETEFDENIILGKLFHSLKTDLIKDSRSDEDTVTSSSSSVPFNTSLKYTKEDISAMAYELGRISGKFTAPSIGNEKQTAASESLVKEHSEQLKCNPHTMEISSSLLNQTNDLLEKIRGYLVYNYINRNGPPPYLVSVKVYGITFMGEAGSKKLARFEVAKKVLDYVLRHPEKTMVNGKLILRKESEPCKPQALSQLHVSLQEKDPQLKNDTDLQKTFTTGEKLENQKENNNRCIPSTEQTRNTLSSLAEDYKHYLDNASKQEQVQLDKKNQEVKNPLPDLLNIQHDGDNPVTILFNLYPNVLYTISQESDVGCSRFTAHAVIGYKSFSGTGSSKKHARNAAAKAALAELQGVTFVPFSENISNKLSATSMLKDVLLPQTFADRIAGLIKNKFLSLSKAVSNPGQRKVLAGIVMTNGENINTAQVIGIATGSKCINGEHLSQSGASVNDSHAEILARRCLCDFLYSQLELLVKPETSSKSIFIAQENEMGYKLKCDYKFHLYISTSPCGDASMFSPHDFSVRNDSTKLFEIKKTENKGVLRTKIESSEGTAVKEGSPIQTWDGIIMAGEQLLTMSCSDKIARWNVVGTQGSLLSYFIEPIYLSSIVLGSKFHPVHLYRAMCGRIEDSISQLPRGYKLNKPLMNCTTSKESREAKSSTVYCLNWTLGQKFPEIINSVTGKDKNDGSSRLSKQMLFHRFMLLTGRLNSKNGKHNIIPSTLLYCDAKKLSKSYNEVKAIFNDAVSKAELGTWIKKPAEQDQFHLENLTVDNSSCQENSPVDVSSATQCFAKTESKLNFILDELKDINIHIKDENIYKAIELLPALSEKFHDLKISLQYKYFNMIRETISAAADQMNIITTLIKESLNKIKNTPLSEYEQFSDLVIFSKYFSKTQEAVRNIAKNLDTSS